MILIAGLGNPAQKYADTRHNVGFMLIDEILKTGGFSELGASKFQGDLFKKGSLLLLKPQTFMNLSGNSVKAVNDFYKPERIIIVHDDIDLDLGAVKFKKGGSSGGHNGIKSIDARIGVGKKQHGQDAADFVLGNFNESEREKLSEILPYVARAVEELICSDIEQIAQKFTIKKARV